MTLHIRKHRNAFIRAIRFGLLCLLWLPMAVSAGVMTKQAMLEAFPSPYIVGDKQTDLPVWPLYQQISTDTPLVGYAFESIDMAAVPGFAGIPYNLLVAIDPDGTFIDVRVLSHHEPVFLEGLGEKPLIDFAKQYPGLSLMQNIKIDGKPQQSAGTDSANAYIDGVTKATASVRIFNQSLLASSLKVAREKLGFAQGRDPDLIARIKMDQFSPMSWDQLLDAGLVQHFHVSNADVEHLFQGTPGEGLDPDVLDNPDGTFIDLFIANLSVPTVGRNLLLPEAWQYLQQGLNQHDQAFLVLSKGTFSFIGEDFVRGKVPELISLQQSELPIEIRDLDLSDRLSLFNLDYEIRLPDALQDYEWKAFHILAQSALDPAYPAEFALHVNRQKGILFPETISKVLTFPTELPSQYYRVADQDNKTWHSLWQGRSRDIAILLAGLAVLTVVLVRYPLLTQGKQHLKWFRPLYLLYTLVFIGWIAQGQLSIVNVTGILQAWLAGRSLEFFLYDPMTVIIWAYIGLTFLIWGRGTFCGWLCPFGALQELIGKLLAVFRLPQLKISTELDRRLKWLKYLVLLGILGVAVVSVPLTGSVVEIEPFKTSITLMFDRSWPFVLWAVSLLLLSLFVYKGYCRYLCPLGATMAIFGKLRIYNWLPRRSECGSPCQLCKQRCEYQAIKPSGQIQYDECFQCLDCVVIYDNDDQCVPLIVAKRHQGRKLKSAAVSQHDPDRLITVSSV